MNTHFKYLTSTHKQGGFALFLVLIAMIVVAFLVVATLQSTNMESRSSANDADRKVAMNRAQTALNIAENTIMNFTDKKNQTIEFKEDCSGGYCSPVSDSNVTQKPEGDSIGLDGNTVILKVEDQKPPATDAWLRSGVLASRTDKTHSIQTSNKDNRASYIIEYLGIRRDTVGSPQRIYLFRVTAKGWGDNDNAQVLLQSNLEATFP